MGRERYETGDPDPEPALMVGIYFNEDVHEKSAEGVLAAYPNQTILNAQMPCGTEIQYVRELLPLEDVQCPCGHPDHWLIYWEPSRRDDEEEPTPAPPSSLEGVPPHMLDDRMTDDERKAAGLVEPTNDP